MRLSMEKGFNLQWDSHSIQNKKKIKKGSYQGK